jgi:hypothetical protein
LGVIQKVKFWNKLDAIKMLATNLGMLVERVEHSGKVSLESLINASLQVKKEETITVQLEEKPAPAAIEGDSLAGFSTDLAETVVLDHLAQPLVDPHAILAGATTRVVYDLFAYVRTSPPGHPVASRVLVVANFSEQSQAVPRNLLRLYGLGYAFRDLITIQTRPGEAALNAVVASTKALAGGGDFLDDVSILVVDFDG